ncbi:MAG: 3-phosphoshikimate 1-carboxyvinyltransferase [Alphaproteobacteria bacterium]|nr:3-phosphoshikimate 1-carboxyvinyltransferase [Alphaproteobacteria bacterium]MBV9372631.1 3-phosphoshikimate 1-carboxyvinyltransferase [Alphaproteobacteria bacterium]MBV9900529.1 3-phosphoshikimate 1-carboxyvinyltransferase [Alphaproteobacteria bacterium]
MRQSEARAATFRASGPLRGHCPLPGDKSISHRALMLAAMARGRSRIAGLSQGADVAATAAALRAMGVGIARDGGGAAVDGVGTGGLLQPRQALDMGNSGTSTRLLMGLVASHPIAAVFTGDASLSRRPMGRVIAPLARLGADVAAGPGGRLPLALRGLAPAAPLAHRMQVPSAQVKSALLLAALNIPGVTRVIEPVATRDHSERMLKAFGAEIGVAGEEISLRGEAELRPRDVAVPADPSAAAFLAVAASIVPGSEVRMTNVGLNPGRIGLFTVLAEMGADITVSNRRDEGGEPVGDLLVRHAPLRGVDVPPELAPSMIDEFPILFVAAAFAAGETRTRGLGELRVKESDRLSAMAEGLAAIGARVKEAEDGLVVQGSGGEPLAGGATIDPRLDHRIAMSFAVAGLMCRRPVIVADMSPADTSFPGFSALLGDLAR